MFTTLYVFWSGFAGTYDNSLRERRRSDLAAAWLTALPPLAWLPGCLR